MLPLIPVPVELPEDPMECASDISPPESVEHVFDPVAAAHSVYAKVFAGDATLACNWTGIPPVHVNSVLLEYARMNLHYYGQKGTDLPQAFFTITVVTRPIARNTPAFMIAQMANCAAPSATRRKNKTVH